MLCASGAEMIRSGADESIRIAIRNGTEAVSKQGNSLKGYLVHSRPHGCANEVGQIGSGCAHNVRHSSQVGANSICAEIRRPWRAARACGSRQNAWKQRVHHYMVRAQEKPQAADVVARQPAEVFPRRQA